METRIRIFLQSTLILVALGIGVQVSAQPEVITDVPDNSTGFVTIGDLVYFRSGGELWRTDGTEAGTIFLESGFDVPSFFIEFNGAAYFTNANNSELWKSDGTPDGTVRLHASGNNELAILGKSDGSFFFQAYDAATGLELYRTDGTAAGTVMLKDINPGAASSIRGLSGVILNNQLIFSADNGTNGTELWRSDGTSAGTVMIKDINPGPEHSIHFDGSFRVYNDLFYFIGITDEHGAEPWVSDGSAEGTRLLKDINPGAAPTPNIQFAIGNNGYLYFLIKDDFNAGPASLWKTAGTETSTSFIKSIGDGATYNLIYSFRVYHDKVYFWNQLDYSTDILFVTDGTSEGTEAVFTVDTPDGSPDGSIYYFGVVNDYLLFTGTAQGYPTPFYRSDGTKAGTEEFALFTAEYHPDGIANRINLTTVGDFSFYADHDGPADVGGNPQDPADYYHLFQADGFTTKSMRTMFGVSTVGTNNITDFNGNVVFTTHNDQPGGTGSKQLWIYDPANVAETEASFTLVNADTDEDIEEISDGEVLFVPSNTNINIRYNPVGSPGSVVFEHENDVVRRENEAPYALAGDRSGNYLPWEEGTVGRHRVEATPYSERGGTGTAGETLVINFEIREAPGTEECMASGTILHERWDGVSGSRVSDIPLNSEPSQTSQLTIFEGPTNAGTHYGARIHGYICPPETGDYTFWIASNDHSELWLSTDDNTNNKVRIAYVEGATGSRQWEKFASQKSGPIPLVAGQRYYIMALHKQGVGTDNLAVGWQLPDGTLERPIPGARLSPADGTENSNPQVYIAGPGNTYDFAAPADVPINVIANDSDGTISLVEFFLGSDKIGEDSEAREEEIYDAILSDLGPGTYTITAKATDNDGATTVSEPVTFAVTQYCNASGTITREYWSGVQGSQVSDVPVNSPPTSVSELTIFEGPSNVGVHYGSRIRGYICPPETGDYIFFISSNDHSELWLSTDADPANKVRIAWVTSATGERQWSKFPSQRSMPVALTQGQRYYIEAIHKQGVGSDHLAVGWQRPGGTFEGPIPGRRLSPFDMNDAARMASAVEDESQKEALYSQIGIYPNPVERGTAELKMSGYEGISETVETRVEIISLTGEVVYAERIRCGGDCGTYLMNINQELMPGLYMVNMKTNGARVSKRLLVK